LRFGFISAKIFLLLLVNLCKQKAGDVPKAPCPRGAFGTLLGEENPYID